MACNSIGRTIIPTPSTGVSVVLKFEFNNDVCEVHTLGPLEGCTFTKYRQALCCGDETNGYDVPILGYNTTSNVYAMCSGDGLVPIPNPVASTHDTTPHTNPTTSSRLRPSASPSPNNGNKIKIGVVFWIAMLIAVTF